MRDLGVSENQAIEKLDSQDSVSLAVSYIVYTYKLIKASGCVANLKTQIKCCNYFSQLHNAKKAIVMLKEIKLGGRFRLLVKVLTVTYYTACFLSVLVNAVCMVC